MVDIPSEYGGLGLDKTTSMLIAEEFSVLGSFAVSLGAHTGIGTMPILYFGTPEQKSEVPARPGDRPAVRRVRADRAVVGVRRAGRQDAGRTSRTTARTTC